MVERAMLESDARVLTKINAAAVAASLPLSVSQPPAQGSASPSVALSEFPERFDISNG